MAVPVVPGSSSQDGHQRQGGAEEDPAADVKDGVLSAPPDEGPEIVGAVLLPGEAGLLPRPPGHQASALALAPLVVPVEIFLILTQSFGLKYFNISQPSIKINKENKI